MISVVAVAGPASLVDWKPSKVFESKAVEDEFDGDQLARLVARQGGQNIAAALIGCNYYRTDPDALQLITGCDARTASVVVRTPAGRGRRAPLRGAYVIAPSVELARAIAASRTPADIEREEAEGRLAALGWTGRMQDDDLAVLSGAIKALEDGEPLGRTARTDVLRRAEKYGQPRPLLKLLKLWAESYAEIVNVPGDILIGLAKALRHSGSTYEALRATDILQSKTSELSSSDRRILFTQRAAIWMDIYELTNEVAALQRARACAEKSWAIEGSDECNLVYKRLHKLEHERER